MSCLGRHYRDLVSVRSCDRPGCVILDDREIPRQLFQRVTALGSFSATWSFRRSVQAVNLNGSPADLISRQVVTV